MSLLDELGLDPESVEWQDLALCQGYEIETAKNDVFFDRYESDTQAAIATDEMCLHCPVLKQCGLEGMQGKTGVWGGIYWNGSGKPDKNRNAHKTEEVWDRIRERMSE